MAGTPDYPIVHLDPTRIATAAALTGDEPSGRAVRRWLAQAGRFATGDAPIIPTATVAEALARELDRQRAADPARSLADACGALLQGPGPYVALGATSAGLTHIEEWLDWADPALLAALTEATPRQGSVWCTVAEAWALDQRIVTERPSPMRLDGVHRTAPGWRVAWTEAALIALLAEAGDEFIWITRWRWVAAQAPTAALAALDAQAWPAGWQPPTLVVRPFLRHPDLALRQRAARAARHCTPTVSHVTRFLLR